MAENKKTGGPGSFTSGTSVGIPYKKKLPTEGTVKLAKNKNASGKPVAKNVKVKSRTKD